MSLPRTMRSSLCNNKIHSQTHVTYSKKIKSTLDTEVPVTVLVLVSCCLDIIMNLVGLPNLHPPFPSLHIIITLDLPIVKKSLLS